MRWILLISLLLFALMLSSCSVMVAPQAPGFSELRPGPVQFADATSVNMTEPREKLTTETMTLSQVIETALLNHPDLRADFAAFEKAAQKVPQVSSLEDPRVNYTQFVEGVQTRVGEQQFVASVNQMFPWFGKLRLWGEIAHKEAYQALESYRSRMLDVRKEVQMSWYRLGYERKAYELALEDKRIIRQTLDAAAALYSSGEQDRGALLQAQTKLARIDNELMGYPARIAALEEELARLTYTDHINVDLKFDTSERDDWDLPDADVIVAKAISLRPEIERYRLGEEQADLRHELAKKEYYPDLVLGLTYVGVGDNPSANPSDEGDDAWGATFGFNIPIPNPRRKAAREEALAQREEATWRRLSVESQIAKDIRSLLPQLQSYDQQLLILHQEILPLADEAYAATEAAYTSGQSTYLDLLETQRTLISVRRDILRTHRDYLLAVSELERVVGGSLKKEVFP